MKGGGQNGMIFGIKITDAPYFLEVLARRPPFVNKWQEEIVKIRLKYGIYKGKEVTKE